MTESDKQLLLDFDYGRISYEDFPNQFSVDLKSDTNFIRAEIKAAIESANPANIQLIIPIIWFSGHIANFVDLLNELLINPNHRSHQQTAKAFTR